MNDQEKQQFIKVWKVLEAITVSLDRIGSYTLHADQDDDNKALHTFFNPNMFQMISEARSTMIEVMEKYDPNIYDELEVLVEDEDATGYWHGEMK